MTQHWVTIAGTYATEARTADNFARAIIGAEDLKSIRIPATDDLFSWGLISFKVWKEKLTKLTKEAVLDTTHTATQTSLEERSEGISTQRTEAEEEQCLKRWRLWLKREVSREEYEGRTQRGWQGWLERLYLCVQQTNIYWEGHQNAARGRKEAVELIVGHFLSFHSACRHLTNSARSLQLRYQNKEQIVSEVVSVVLALQPHAIDSCTDC